MHTRLLFIVAAIWIAFELVINVAKHSKAADVDRRDRWSLRFVWLGIGTGFFLAGMMTRFHQFEVPAALRPYTYWGGLALVFVGITIRWIAIATLKKYFTVDVAIAKDHKVIDHGLYAFVRHPSYLGTLLGCLGIGLAFCNWLSLAVGMPFSIAAMAYRISVEEAALTAALGDDYRAYAARTKRLIPGIF